ncbi:MAG: EpsI family protein [Candidatus Thiodiazotropha sp. (ex Monitilora ramsayi)]|nr:EpsI family protein [Candidatus Thiodiazotropha sp. (ex Monitilora ramsayi)]
MVSSESLKLSAGRPIDGLLVAISILVLAVVYSGTVVSFYNVFSEEGSDQSHAPLLVLVSLFLIHRAWSSGHKNIRIHANLAFVLLLAGVSLVWLAAGLVFVEAGQQVSLILMFVLVVLSLFGVSDGRRYIVPILLLLTLLPVWNVFVPYLQTLSAVLSSLMLDLSGVTSTREGFLLIIPNGTFEVADECSGLKFQVIGITLALIHTQLSRVGLGSVLLYMLAASGLALISNVIRIYVVVLIGYAYGMDHELVHDHNSIGWVIFTVLFFPFLLLGEKQFQKRKISVEIKNEKEPAKLSLNRRILSVSLVIFAFSLGPGLSAYFNRVDLGNQPDRVSVNNVMGDWHQFSTGLGEWEPLWTVGDRTLEGRFREGSNEIDLFATQFLKQRHGREAVNLSHRVYNIEKWSRISRSAKVVKISDKTEMAVEETLLKSPGNKKRLVWLWYRTNDKLVQSNAEAKLNNLIGVIRGQPDITVYILSKEIVRGEEHASGVLADFVRDYLTLVGDRNSFG